jgi:hypothetical protein
VGLGEPLGKGATVAQQQEREPEQPKRGWGEQSKGGLFRALEAVGGMSVLIAQFEDEQARERRSAGRGEGDGDEVARQEGEQEVAVEVGWRCGEGEREVFEGWKRGVGAECGRKFERTEPEKEAGGGEAEEGLTGREREPVEPAERRISRHG